MGTWRITSFETEKSFHEEAAGLSAWLRPWFVGICVYVVKFYADCYAKYCYVVHCANYTVSQRRAQIYSL